MEKQLEAGIDKADFIIKKCGPDCLDRILAIQTEIFSELPDTDILRKNTVPMLRGCLSPPHVTLGAWYGGELAAFSVLYFPGDDGDGDGENLAAYLENVDTAGLNTVNNKLCIVRKPFRGNSLQYELGRRLEQYAVEAGCGLICATASPKNSYSIHNMQQMGYIYNRTLSKYGLERNLYYKFIRADV
jgi:hypothetical protein